MARLGGTAPGIISNPGRRAKWQVTPGDRRVVGLDELRPVVGHSKVPVGVWCNYPAQLYHGGSPGIEQYLHIIAAGVWQLEQRGISHTRPQVYGLLGLLAEGYYSLQIGSIQPVEKFIAPAYVQWILEQFEARSAM